MPSPGVPANLPGLVAARARGHSHLERNRTGLALPARPLVAITGSNGKTTTTSLLGHILAGAGMPVIVAGNIGTPLISRVDDSSDSSVTVAEVSSFQLELIDSLRPDVAVLLNLTPDHLDRHASFEDYCRAKAAHLRESDRARLRRLERRRCRCWRGSRSRAAARVSGSAAAARCPPAPSCADGQIVFRDERGETVLLERGDIGLRGEHNVENVLAAASAAWLVGAPPAAIAAGVRSFPGVEHRLEFVAEIGGVQFFNDSKATNVDAALKAIDAFPGGLFVILGGKDKGSDYTPLDRAVARSARNWSC